MLPAHLCLARHSLERAVSALHPDTQLLPTDTVNNSPPSSHQKPEIAWGSATVQAIGTQPEWLVGPLQWGQLSRRPDAAAMNSLTALRRPSVNTLQGLCLITLAASNQAAPRNSADWDTWLYQHASAYRLASPVPNPPLVALWLNTRGEFSAATRRHGAWQALHSLRLPGSQMLRLPLHSAVQNLPAKITPFDVQALDPVPPQGRYSRLAGALGDQVLQRMQTSVIAIVGLGRTGAPLAHSLARMGIELLLIDPDHLELHNLDGDGLPQHEGLYKVDSSSRLLRGLMRPGSQLDGRALNITSPVCGALLARADLVISCVDNDLARLWTSAWCTALMLPLLDIGTAVRADGAEADLRLVPPGCGCLACVGGFSSTLPRPDEWMHGLPTQGDFRQQRLGSLRSWSVAAGHLGLRMVEQLYAGQLRSAVFRRLAESPSGGLDVQDLPTSPSADPACPLCGSLAGQGSSVVQTDVLQAIANAINQGAVAAQRS